MIKTGFDDVGKRFDENKNKHQIIHQKLEDIELRLENVVFSF